MATYDDALAAMRADGLEVEAIDADGVLHRVPHDGDKGTKRTGWYICHEHRRADGSVAVFGAYGDWRTQETKTLAVDWRGVSEEEREATKARMRELRKTAELERAQAAKQAADKAAKLWPRLPESGASAYLERKRVGAHGLRFARGGMVVMPLRSMDGRLRGLQWIGADGSKRFSTGMRMDGSCHVIGDDEGQPIALAEGYATAAIVYQATGWLTIVCCHAGNLKPVAQAARVKYGAQRELVICADHDTNPGTSFAIGERKAADAAAAVGATVALACVDTYKAELRAHTQPESVRLDAGLRAALEGGAPGDWNDVARAYGLKATRAALLAAREAGLAVPASEDEPPPPADEGAHWRMEAARASDNWRRATQRACELVLEHDPDWKDVLAFDELVSEPVKLSAPPWPGGQAGDWNDYDTAELISWFGRKYGLEPAGQTLANALIVRARRRPFHPIREWLESLPYRGTSVLDIWLREAMQGKEDPEYMRIVGRRWLISAVARVMQPGCKADLCLILEGEQGLMKSTALHILFQPWYSDQPIQFGDKDSYLAVRGILCLELAEMDAWRKADHSTAKAFISQRVDRYRPPYGHRMMTIPRQCVLAGTTNQREYLRDPSGNRRYLPVRCGPVDTDFLREHREDLFAEALMAYRAGEPWWLEEGEETRLAELARDTRTQDDPWCEGLARYMMKSGAQRWSTEVLLIEACGVDRGHQTQQHQTRLAGCMHTLGATPARFRDRGVLVRGYQVSDEWRARWSGTSGT